MMKTFECFKCGEVVKQNAPTHLLQERMTVCRCGQVHHVKTVMSLKVDWRKPIVDWTIVMVSASEAA